VIFFVDPVVQKYKSGRQLATTLEFVYPICDVLILGAVAGIFALTAWRPGKTWLLLGLGLFMFTAADSVSAVQAVEGSYQGDYYDFVWTPGALLIAWAAWRPSSSGERACPDAGRAGDRDAAALDQPAAEAGVS
jgi:hypothetical protein